jgi:uncharacterized protein YegJ (DUF2314 family)
MSWLKRILGGRSDEESADREVYFAPPSPDMEEASRRARDTFRYFWREMAWEQRRVVKGCDVASVKAPFSDDGDLRGDRVEHMWISEVFFDGRIVTGVLVNSPEWLRSVKRGEVVELPLEEISDWMYAIRGRVYGAFTVNVLRASMDPQSRAEHDDAWGLDFGDPASVQLVPSGDGWNGPDAEHPMSVNMRASFAEQLAKSAALAKMTDEQGWTLLHHLALAGSLDAVRVLVEHGADPNALTSHGMTPLALASSLKWTAVVDYLRSNGAG